MSPSHPLLEMHAISKRFAGVRALHQVSLLAAPGEVVAIVGENGAGKSTLLKILGGILRSDEGEILVDQQPRRLGSVREAEDLGIRLIHQELNLAGDLSIAENIFLGRFPYRGPRWLPLTDTRAMQRQAAAILDKVGLRVPPETPVRRLSVAQRQLVEVGKVLSSEVRLLVFDEPTSSLSLDEANGLLSLIEQLRGRGVAILYVTHRLQEVMRVADRVVVLRDGEHVGTLAAGEISEQTMVSLMIGRDLKQLFQKTEHTIECGRPALSVANLCYPGGSEAVSFCIHSGEIVGFAGLVGAGRSELARALFGIEPTLAGCAEVHGRKVRGGSPVEAIAAGLALVPEDRKQCGLLLQLAIDFNIALSALPRLTRTGWYHRRTAATLASQYQAKLDIRTNDLRCRAAVLSGGNQQKTVLAKWLAVEPRVLILDEPTRGVDVGAKSAIYHLIVDLAARGMAVMLISSEMEEIIGVSDRVIVMHKGKIVGELSSGQITESAIMELAVGGLSSASRP